MLEEVEVRPGFIQCDNFAIDYRVVWEISESVEDERILTIEGISPSRKQMQPASRFHGYGAVPIEFDLFCGVRRYVGLKMRGQYREARNFFLRHIIPIRGLGSGDVRYGRIGKPYHIPGIGFSSV